MIPKETSYKTHTFLIKIVPADDLAPLGARSSAGTVMTNCVSYVYIKVYNEGELLL